VTTTYEGALNGSGLRIAIAVARFNDFITDRLLAGALDGLQRHGVDESSITVARVPGAFEIPVAAKQCAASGSFDAVVCLGAVIRGDTAHFEYVAGECARGLQQAGLDTGVPMVFGVLTTEDLDQALARSEDAGGHNVGEECALGAVEMVGLLRRLRERMG
jgi:6,7-dimethyl-8-ribityllumazine synthase